MISFVLSIVLLVLAYFTYGKFVEKIFGVDKSRETPATKLIDEMVEFELKNISIN